MKYLKQKFILLLSAALVFTQAELLSAQEKDSAVSRMDKKFNCGLAFYNAWSSIRGTGLPREYAYKPSLGGAVKAEYYFLNFIGIGGGIGFQQRGAIEKNPDEVSDVMLFGTYQVGDRDSTYRERLRFNCWDIPLYLNFRSPAYKNKIRASGKAGGIYSMNFQTQNIFISAEDGFHQITFPSSDYYKNDLLFFGSVGADINAGESAILQLHLFRQYGLSNVFSNSGIYSGSKGFNQVWGIQIGFMY